MFWALQYTASLLIFYLFYFTFQVEYGNFNHQIGPISSLLMLFFYYTHKPWKSMRRLYNFFFFLLQLSNELERTQEEEIKKSLFYFHQYLLFFLFFHHSDILSFFLISVCFCQKIFSKIFRKGLQSTHSLCFLNLKSLYITFIFEEYFYWI